MKVCILFSGYLRTFHINYPKIKSVIIDQFETVDIYFHITSDENETDQYLNNITKNFEFIHTTIKPHVILYEKNNNKYNKVSNLWSKYYKLNSLKKQYEKENNFKYDLVIKLRPDMYIIQNNIEFNMKTDTIYIPSDSKIDLCKLTNINDKYICDVFAYGDSTSMDNYFDINIHLNKLFQNYGYVSETLLYHYLQNEKIKYETIDFNYNIILSTCNILAICGDSGSGKTTLGTILKSIFHKSFIMECDRYHKWERNDPNWSLMTHLNPDANYIMKMSDDLFDLKIGKNIYQIDYDHTNGKFTEKQQIEPSDNIIVCGLHCLYSKDNNNTFNIKIFIDTDENLKIPWKVQRDMKKRNYTIEKIMNQINSRKDDYIKYIVPQKKQSDLIIQFFTNVKWTMENIFDDKPIFLNISIRKKIDFGKICLLFNKYMIQYKIDVNENEEFINFIFYQSIFHKELLKEVINIELLNNYYDIIIFFIFFIHNHNL